MSPSSSRALAPVLLAALFAAGIAVGRAAEAKDDAGFFSADAVKKANEALQAIQRAYQKNVVIETVDKVPADKREAYDALPKGASAARNKFFDRWAGERLAATKADIYILIVKQAGRVEIAMNEETGKKAFTNADRKLLTERLVKRFKEKEYDTALREATTFIDRRLDAN